MVINIQEGEEFYRRFPVSRLAGMVVATRINQGVRTGIVFVLDGPLIVPVMVSRGACHIVYRGAASIGGENVIKIENGQVVRRVAAEPFVDQPVVEGPGVGGIGRITERWSGKNDEELVRPALKIVSQILINPFGVGHGMVFGIGVIASQRIAADGGNGIGAVSL